MIAIALLVAWAGIRVLQVLVGSLMTLYLISLFWQSRLLIGSLSEHDKSENIESRALRVQKDEDLPIISAMVPVYLEGERIIAKLIENLSQLNYPDDKLQIMLLLDADKSSTIAAALSVVPDHYEVLVVDVQRPRTKPRVLNSALPYARGEYIVVWDIEDHPDPNQLRKAMDVLLNSRESDPGLIGVQARLAFDISAAGNLMDAPFHKRLLAQLLVRWQAAAYNQHFRIFLPGINRSYLPLPLGGTSNVFHVERLREIGAWDSWNVTEDLDLGIRLARRGHHMRMIDSTTVEEPNTELINCIRQWSRWEKGTIQTWFVHMRDPLRLFRELGVRGFLSFQFIVGMQPFLLLINPLFLLMTLLYIAFQPVMISALFPPVVLYIGNISLIAGNLFFIFASATASLLSRQYGLVWACVLAIGHWLLMSVAAWLAVWQIVNGRVHHWEATVHGQTLVRTKQPTMAGKS